MDHCKTPIGKCKVFARYIGRNGQRDSRLIPVGMVCTVLVVLMLRHRRTA